MTNERFNDDVVPDSARSGGMNSGATAADSADMPRGTGLTDVTGDTVAGDTDMNADPDFSPGADYTGDTDLTVDSTPRDTDLTAGTTTGQDANLSDLGDPSHLFDQTNGLADLGGETDEMAEDSTSRADRVGDDDDGGGPVPFPSSR